MLYHATFKAYIPEIKKYGLGAKQHKNWEISTDGVVCLTNDPEVANDFCECAEDVPEDIFESGIVVFMIDERCLDKNKLFVDPNVNIDEDDDNYDDTVEYLIYKGVIPSNQLVVINNKGVIKGVLSNLNSCPTYY